MSHYMFSDKEITPTTWIDLQKAICNQELSCVEMDARVARVTDTSGGFCFIFWDEVGQASNPYESEEAARSAARRYGEELARTDLSGW